jgi:hypothetical protein
LDRFSYPTSIDDESTDDQSSFLDLGTSYARFSNGWKIVFQTLEFLDPGVSNAWNAVRGAAASARPALPAFSNGWKSSFQCLETPRLFFLTLEESFPTIGNGAEHRSTFPEEHRIHLHFAAARHVEVRRTIVAPIAEFFSNAWKTPDWNPVLHCGSAFRCGVFFQRTEYGAGCGGLPPSPQEERLAKRQQRCCNGTRGEARPTQLSQWFAPSAHFLDRHFPAIRNGAEHRSTLPGAGGLCALGTSA